MIEIKAEPKALVQVELVGVLYAVHAPKSSLSLKLGARSKTAGDDPSLVIETLNEMVTAVFGDDAGHVQARLDDPGDALDIDHIMALVEALAEADAGDPPTSSSASPRSPSTTGAKSTAGRRR